MDAPAETRIMLIPHGRFRLFIFRSCSFESIHMYTLGTALRTCNVAVIPEHMSATPLILSGIGSTEAIVSLHWRELCDDSFADFIRPARIVNR